MIDEMGFEVREIVDFLLAFHEYMKKYGVNLDKKSTIERIKKSPVGEIHYVGLPDSIINALSAITGQKEKRYILKDLDPETGLRMELNCDSNSSFGYGFNESNGGYALFKLPKSS